VAELRGGSWDESGVKTTYVNLNAALFQKDLLSGKGPNLGSNYGGVQALTEGTETISFRIVIEP
jgi:hypothetical protein